MSAEHKDINKTLMEVNAKLYGYIFSFIYYFLASLLMFYLFLEHHWGWGIVTAMMVGLGFINYNKLTNYLVYAKRISKISKLWNALSALNSDELQKRLDKLAQYSASRIERGLSTEESLDRMYKEMEELRDEFTSS